MKKTILNFLLAIAALAVIMLNVNVVLDSKAESIVKLGSINKVFAEESSSGESSSGESSSGESSSDAETVVKRLKVVDCKCPNGKTGKTAKCYTDGDKEKCTATQQGLTGCYSTSMFNAGDLLCEGV